MTLTNDRSVLLSERVPHKDKTVTVKHNLILVSGHGHQMGLDTKTDWLAASHNMTLTWLVSQLELLLLRDSIWSAHDNSGPSSSNTTNQLRKPSPWSLESPSSALATLRPAHRHLAAKHGGLLLLMQASLMLQSFASIHQEFMWLSLQIPELTSHIFINYFCGQNRRAQTLSGNFNTELDLSFR
jgi:hypothetical protein